MFKVSFQFLNKTYTGTVQKTNHQPVQFVVSGICPLVRNIPEKLVFISNPANDQLVYQSFIAGEHNLLRTIGESIFLTCHQQKINVHK